MSSSARRDLEEALGKGVVLDPAQPTWQTGHLSVRRSAVLMLFSVNGMHMARSSQDDVDVAGLDILLTRRSLELRHHAGQIAFPGGGVEAFDDGVAAAALREAAEETGIDTDGVEVLGAFPEVFLPVSNNLVTPVVGWWDVPGAASADFVETTDVWQVPVAGLLDPLARGTGVLTRGGVTHRGPAFLFEDGESEHVVWGFTGGLLSGLFDRAGWTRPWDRSRLIQVSV